MSIIVFFSYIAAVMSTADSLLIVTAATTLKNIYQSFINPNASEGRMLRLCWEKANATARRNQIRKIAMFLV